MKTHYALLGLTRDADADAIKKAFRREIARYHPDKLAHLGTDFQDMAAVRARELTAAYSTLNNVALRAAYDATLPEGTATDPQPLGFPNAESREDTWIPAPNQTKAEVRGGPPSGADIDREQREVGSAIVKRAALERVRSVFRAVVGEFTSPRVPGFDLACVSSARRSFFRRVARPSVLVRLVPVVDRGVVTEAWGHAAKAGIDGKPVLVLLVGDRLAPESELSHVVHELERRHPAQATSVYPVAVDMHDWSAAPTPGSPDCIRTLLARLTAA